MKYICLGYYDKSKHDAMIEAEKQVMFDACFTYDDHSATGGNSEYVTRHLPSQLFSSNWVALLERKELGIPCATMSRFRYFVPTIA
jgi:hypothetical protein